MATDSGNNSSAADPSIFVTAWTALSPAQRHRVKIGMLSAIVLLPLLVIWMNVKDDVFSDPPRQETARPAASSDGSSDAMRPPALEHTRGNPERGSDSHLWFGRGAPQRTQPTPMEELIVELGREGLRRSAAQQQQQQGRGYQVPGAFVNRCSACGGRGTYTYVDGYGQLHRETCTYCNGMPTRW